MKSHISTKSDISTKSEFYDGINQKTDNLVYKIGIKYLSLKISEVILAIFRTQNKTGVKIIEEYNERMERLVFQGI